MNNAAMVLVRTALEQLRASIPGRPEVRLSSNAVGLAFDILWDVKPRALRYAIAFSLEEMVNAQFGLYDTVNRRAAEAYAKIEGSKEHDTRSTLKRNFGRISAGHGKRRRGGKGEVHGDQ